MLLSNQAIYIDLIKSGSSFIENCLHSLCNHKTLLYYNQYNIVANLETIKYSIINKSSNTHIGVPKHGPLYNKQLILDNFCFISLRNPWLFYPSFYNYFNLKEHFSFEEWLVKIKNRDYTIRYVGLDYRRDIKSYSNCLIGMTDVANSKKNLSEKELNNWFEEYFFPNFYIIGLKEGLTQDFCKMFENFHYMFDTKKNWKDTIEQIKEKDINFEGPILKRYKNSNRLQNLNYKEFYTDTLIDLVYELDKILIDKFNLKVPF